METLTAAVVSLAWKNADILSFYVPLGIWVVTLDTGCWSPQVTMKVPISPGHLVPSDLFIRRICPEPPLQLLLCRAPPLRQMRSHGSQRTHAQNRDQWLFVIDDRYLFFI